MFDILEWVFNHSEQMTSLILTFPIAVIGWCLVLWTIWTEYRKVWAKGYPETLVTHKAKILKLFWDYRKLRIMTSTLFIYGSWIVTSFIHY